MPRRLEWDVDAAGLLKWVPYHDGFVISLGYSLDRRSIELAVRTADSRTVAFGFLEIAQLRINNFLEGNIVSDIFIWTVDKVPDQTISSLDNGWGGHLFEISALGEREAEVTRIKQRFGGKYLVQLLCSYGASISLISDRPVIEEEHLE